MGTQIRLRNTFQSLPFRPEDWTVASEIRCPDSISFSSSFPRVKFKIRLIRPNSRRNSRARSFSDQVRRSGVLKHYEGGDA